MPDDEIDHPRPRSYAAPGAIEPPVKTEKVLDFIPDFHFLSELSI